MKWMVAFCLMGSMFLAAQWAESRELTAESHDRIRQLHPRTSNDLLGRLLKHTLLKQFPLQRPFAEYVEVATCEYCHLVGVDKGF